MNQQEMDEGRRQFLKMLGIGAVTVATATVSVEQVLALVTPTQAPVSTPVPTLVMSLPGQTSDLYNSINRRLLQVYAKELESMLFDLPDQISRLRMSVAMRAELGKMVAAREVYEYSYVCDNSNNTSARLDNGEVMTTEIWLKPVGAREVYLFPFQYVNPRSEADGSFSRPGYIRQDFLA